MKRVRVDLDWFRTPAAVTVDVDQYGDADITIDRQGEERVILPMIPQPKAATIAAALLGPIERAMVMRPVFTDSTVMPAVQVAPIIIATSVEVVHTNGGSSLVVTSNVGQVFQLVFDDATLRRLFAVRS